MQETTYKSETHNYILKYVVQVSNSNKLAETSKIIDSGETIDSDDETIDSYDESLDSLDDIVGSTIIFDDPIIEDKSFIDEPSIKNKNFDDKHMYDAVVDDTKQYENDINILATYEAYDTGIVYEKKYTSKDLHSLHKKFTLDPTIIIDIISNPKLITKISVDTKKVIISYGICIVEKIFDINMVIDRMSYEGMSDITEDLQRQNKILSNKVSELNIRFNKMSMWIAESHLSKIQDETYYDPLFSVIDINKIRYSDTESYVYHTLSQCPEDDFKYNAVVKSILKHANLNIDNKNGVSMLIQYVKNTYLYDCDYVYFNEYIKAGADVNYRGRSGQTALMYCTELLKNKSDSNMYLTDIKNILIKAGAK